MYKGASSNAQKAATFLHTADLERGEVSLSPEEVRASLVAKWKQLHSLITGGGISNAQRKKIGHEMVALQNQISAIRPKSKCPGVENFFIDVVRESVTPAQFGIWMREAVKRLKDE